MIIRDSETGNIILPHELSDEQLTAVMVKVRRAHKEDDAFRYCQEALARGIIEA